MKCCFGQMWQADIGVEQRLANSAARLRWESRWGRDEGEMRGKDSA